MELRHLRYFVAVAESLHFGRAAESLLVAQPSLSQQIRNLERELGVVLLKRSRRTVSLTDAGRVFLTEAKRTLDQAQRALDTARRAARGQLGRLVVSFASVATFDCLPRAIAAFTREYPGVELIFRELTTADQIARLKDGTVDVALLTHFNAEDGLVARRVSRVRLVAALPCDHPLTRKRRLNLASLAAETFICTPRERGPAYYDHFIALCQRAGFAPRIAQTQNVTQLSTVIALVAAGVGVALVPLSMACIHLKGVTYRELSDVAEIDVTMAWLPSNQLPSLEAFVNVVLRRE